MIVFWVKTNRNLKDTPTKPTRKQNIRIMSVNCRSLVSSTKQIALQDLIETHNPDVILGSESHLDPQLTSSEIFPSTYSNPYRKDRKLGEGGVFIAVKDDLITTEVKVNTECEVTWATLTIQGSQPIQLDHFIEDHQVRLTWWMI